MRLDVFFGVQRSCSRPNVQGRLVAVIDVLRASTTIAIALANGARAVIPLRELRRGDHPLARASSAREVRLAGERKMLPIPGFDFGNSPGEFTREAVEGKTILLTTTNGTGALLARAGRA